MSAMERLFRNLAFISAIASFVGIGSSEEPAPAASTETSGAAGAAAESESIFECEATTEMNADAVFEILGRVVDAKRAGAEVRIEQNGKRMRMIFVEAPDVESKPQTPKPEPKIVPKNVKKNDSAKTDAPVRKRFKLGAETKSGLHAAFSKCGDSLDVKTFVENNKELLAPFVKHYGENDEGAKKLKEALRTWFTSFKKGKKTDDSSDDNDV